MILTRTSIAVAAWALFAGAPGTILLANEPKPTDSVSKGGHMTEAQKFADRDPKEDFEAAMKKHDVHFFAV